MNWVINALLSHVKAIAAAALEALGHLAAVQNISEKLEQIWEGL